MHCGDSINSQALIDWWLAIVVTAVVTSGQSGGRLWAQVETDAFLDSSVYLTGRRHATTRLARRSNTHIFYSYTFVNIAASAQRISYVNTECM